MYLSVRSEFHLSCRVILLRTFEGKVAHQRSYVVNLEESCQFIVCQFTIKPRNKELISLEIQISIITRIEFGRIEFSRIEFSRIEFNRIEFSRISFSKIEFSRIEFDVKSLSPNRSGIISLRSLV